MNQITLVGRAGRDPDFRTFESGTMVANLTLATEGQDGKPDWHNLEIWGKKAQVAADYVRKGSLIGVIGSLHIRTWTDRSTNELRSKPVIYVDRLELLGSRRDAESTAPAATTAAPSPAPAQPDPLDEEIPF